MRLSFKGSPGGTPPGRIRRALLCLGAATALGACETSPTTRSAGLDVRAAIARGEIRSPKGAAVAVASIDGAPGPIGERLKRDMASEAAARDITFADPSSARYLVRGYLDAYATENGTSVHSIWDVYDAARQRTRRVDEAFDLPAPPGADAWSGVGDDVVASIASKGADDLAIVLGETPEAGAPPLRAAAVADHPAD